MLILGLGSNLGYPLENLRQALCHLKALAPIINVKAVSPVYYSVAQLTGNAPVEWQKSYLNIAVRCECSPVLSPEKILFLIKSIEKKMGRVQQAKWAPRIIDIDILVFYQLQLKTAVLEIPHPALFTRPFALLPLLDIYPAKNIQHFSAMPIWVHHPKLAPFKTKKIQQSLYSPRLMGILNITPDSFSDGDQYLCPKQALKQFRHLMCAGAEIIDIGAEASGPRAMPISAKTEYQRLLPVLQHIQAYLQQNKHKICFNPLISIDTYHPETVDNLLNNPIINVHMINDVSGKQAVAIANMIKNTPVCYITMHNLGIPTSPLRVLSSRYTAQEIIAQIYQWAEKKINLLVKTGLNDSQIIFDPGIGFGKTAEQSWQIIQHVREFKPLASKLLIGHSRKSFLNLYFNQQKPKTRDFHTAIISSYLASQEVDYLRVHNIAQHRVLFDIYLRLQDCSSSHVFDE